MGPTGEMSIDRGGPTDRVEMLSRSVKNRRVLGVSSKCFGLAMACAAGEQDCTENDGWAEKRKGHRVQEFWQLGRSEVACCLGCHF